MPVPPSRLGRVYDNSMNLVCIPIALMSMQSLAFAATIPLDIHTRPTTSSRPICLRTIPSYQLHLFQTTLSVIQIFLAMLPRQPPGWSYLVPLPLPWPYCCKFYYFQRLICIDGVVSGVAKHGLAFIISTISSIIASLFLLIGASIWAVVIHRSQAVNNVLLKLPSSPTQVAIGITVSSGSGLYLAWAAFVLMFFSVIPYMFR